MSVSSGPDTSTNGLIYCIDPGNRKSYSGSGTTVTDVIRGISTTLTNGPTYSEDVSGNWVFDGSNDYISVVNSTRSFQWTPSGAGSNTLAFEMWVKSTDTAGLYISKPWNGNGEYNYYMGDYYFRAQIGSSSYTLYYASFASGNWEHVVACITPTQMTFYRNGQLSAGPTNHGISTNTPTNGDFNDVIPLAIMTLYPYGSWAGNTGFSILGSVGLLKVYNIIPTAAEVLQSYNSMKNRFRA